MSEITQLLVRIGSGDDSARDWLLVLLYQDLRKLEPRLAQVVEMRCFAGLGENDIASVSADPIVPVSSRSESAGSSSTSLSSVYFKEVLTHPSSCPRCWAFVRGRTAASRPSVQTESPIVRIVAKPRASGIFKPVDLMHVRTGAHSQRSAPRTVRRDRDGGPRAALLGTEAMVAQSRAFLIGTWRCPLSTRQNVRHTWPVQSDVGAPEAALVRARS
jgi:hypothetical protein